MTVTTGIFIGQQGQVNEASLGLTAPMGFLDSLRRAVRELRAEGGVDLIDVAYFSRKSESTLSKFETGKTEAPDHLDRVIDAYAEALGMTPSNLVEAIALRMKEDEAAQAVEHELQPDGAPTAEPQLSRTRASIAKSQATSRPRKASRRPQPR